MSLNFMQQIEGFQFKYIETYDYALPVEITFSHNTQDQHLWQYNLEQFTVLLNRCKSLGLSTDHIDGYLVEMQKEQLIVDKMKPEAVIHTFYS